MVERADGKAFAANAWVDPARCVGCAVCVGSCDSEAMNLPWFPVRDVEGRVLEAIRAEADVSPVALVAADIDGGMDYFRQDYWEKLLPGYRVVAVPTASWVRPRFVEKLIKAGVGGVLIIRDSRNESPARDGNQWVEHRLAGQRKPYYRPRQAGEKAEAWRVVDYDFAHDDALAQVAVCFRTGDPDKGEAVTGRGGLAGFAMAGLLFGLLMAAVVAPSHLRVSNPANPEPEFVFSFKVFGEVEQARDYSPEDDANRPIHMRGRVTEKPRRHLVVVRITIDGRQEERSYAAKGIGHDGPSLGEWRRLLPEGDSQVLVEIDRGGDSEPLRWEEEVTLRLRHITVLTFDPDKGFVLEE